MTRQFSFKNGTGKRIGILLSLILLAVAGNFFSLSLFMGVDFLFGSIATLIIVWLFGFWCGVLSAVVSGAYTLLLWGHPYAIVIFVLEAMAVWLLRQKTERNIVQCVIIFWLCLGMPAVFVLYKFAVQTDLLSAYLIMLKQCANGIFNALIANVLMTVLALEKRIGKIDGTIAVPIREVLFNVVALLIFFPILMMIVIDGREVMQNLENRALSHVKVVSSDVSMHILRWFNHHLHAVKELARVPDVKKIQAGAADLQTKVETTKKMFPDFHNMYIADETGKTIAFYPPYNERGETTIGMDFSDREYFRALQTTHRPYLSNVFMGRGGVFSPIVTITAPILDNNRFAGYALGALNLTNIRNIIELYNDTVVPIDLTLTDEDNRIIASTKTEFKFMDYYDEKKSAERISIEDALYLRLPDKKNLAAMTRFKESFYIMETFVSDELRWKLIVEHPLAYHQQILYKSYIQYFSIIFLFSLATFVLTAFVSRWFTVPLTELANFTSAMRGEKLNNTNGIEHIYKSPIAEIRSLAGNFGSMSRVLEANFLEIEKKNSDLKNINAELQLKFEELEKNKAVLDDLTTDLNRKVKELRCRYEISKIFNDADLPVAIRAGRLLKLLADFEVNASPHCAAITIMGQEFAVPDGQKTAFRYEREITAMGQAVGKIAVGCIEQMTDHAEDEFPEDLKHLTEFIAINWGHLIERENAGSERKRLEAKLQQAQKMEAVGTLAGGIAHDFNNILSSIMGYTELAMFDAEKSSPLESYLKEIHIAGKRAGDLVKQILTFARQSNDELVPVQVDVVVKEALALLKAGIPSTITLNQNIESDSLITGNHTKIHQVVMNLCTNAVQAMEADGGVLEVSLTDVCLDADFVKNQVDLSSGNYLALRVSDTGVGISDKVMAHIFDPYFTTKAGQKGTGLGLSTVHGIVKDHGGGITVDSRENKGTVFTVYLPVSDKTAGKRPDNAENTGDTDTRSYGTERILIVDDEYAVAKMLAYTLKKNGFDVTVQADSLAALALFQKQPDSFDLVLSDFTMPNMTGDTLAKEMMRVRPDIPVVIVTGYSQNISKKSAADIGIRAVLTKPVSSITLITVIRKILEDARKPAAKVSV